MTMFGKQMSRAVALAAAGIASLSGIDDIRSNAESIRKGGQR